MDTTKQHLDIRDAIGKLCAQFGGSYWQTCDRDNKYPKGFVTALTEGGYLAQISPTILKSGYSSITCLAHTAMCFL